MRAIPQCAVDLAKSKEKCILFVYDDAHYPPHEAKAGDVISGTLTGGYGHTGPEIVIGLAVTQDKADSWLKNDLQTASFRLGARINNVVAELTDNQYGALLDFVMNLGAGDNWTIWKRLNAKQFDQVPLELAKFVNTKINGVTTKSNGLVERRNAEIALWSTAEPGSDDTPLPSSITRSAVTPPTPSDPVPMSKSKALIAGFGGVITAGPPLVNQITQAITPYSDQSDYVKHMLGILATIGAALAAGGLAFMYIQKRNARN